MNCRDIESLILAERDGALAKDRLAALSDHVADCPACRQLRGNLAAALAAYKTGVETVAAPDADAAWRELRGRLREPVRGGKRSPLTPVIWFGAPLAAAAALAFAFFALRPVPPASVGSLATAPVAPYDSSIIAGADFVEAGDPDASTLVFIDAESGWLVVWATNPGADTNG